jgi:hypothetical protein
MLNIANHQGMQIMTTKRCHLAPGGMAAIKKTEDNSGQGCGKREFLHTINGNYQVCYEKQCGGSLKK